jgi:hypothetical protein
MTIGEFGRGSRDAAMGFTLASIFFGRTQIGITMKKGTGPRTPRGKARSSKNAAKHWIESNRILPEEQKEAAILRKGFTDDFNPDGMSENEVIDDLTFNRLIERRIDIAFTREFSKAANEKLARWIENSERPGSQYWLRCVEVGYEGWAERGLGERLRPNDCIVGLEALKSRIADRGPQPEDLAQLRLYYGSHPTEDGAMAICELTSLTQKKSGQVETAHEERAKLSLLETLQEEIERQRLKRELAEAAYDIDTESDIQEPARPALDALLRYRAANIREFRDLLDCFERIRRLRSDAA